MDAPVIKRSGKREYTCSADHGLRTSFIRCDERHFSGFVVDTQDPTRKFTVEILIDGIPFRVLRADGLVCELVAEQIGDGCYGFTCSLPGTALTESSLIEARLANVGTSVGTPIVLAAPTAKDFSPSEPATLRWLGGLRFSGWIVGFDETAMANVHVDGTPVMRVRPSTWSYIGGIQEDARPVRAFDFHLPNRFANGSVHQIALIDDAGENIAGSAVYFLAFQDGLRETVIGSGVSEQEHLRAELFDQLLPMSVPFSQYEAWRERFPIASDPPVSSRCAVIMVGSGAMEKTLETLHEQTHADWVATFLPHPSDSTGLDNKLARAFLSDEGADCQFVVFALAGSLFGPAALQRFVAAFSEFPNAQAVYADVDLQANDGSLWPLALSAFDYERMLEQGYCAHLFALRRAAAERALSGGAASLYRLFNTILDDEFASPSNIVHVSAPLAILPELDREAACASLVAAARAHLKRRGVEAQVNQFRGHVFPAIHIIRKLEHRSTTIIIPTRNRKKLLQSCIESIRPAVERTRAEILIVDNDSTDSETLGYLAEFENSNGTVLRVPGEFNFSRLNNCAAQIARGEVLCLLNNDIKACDDYWLEEMLSRIVEHNVGAVGALLMSASGVVQHGGVVLGPSFAATHAFNDRINGDGAYADLLCVAHECSAVTAACLLTHRHDYLEAGGMDEVRFPVNFNDVDYCLKLRSINKRIVFTPHAKLLHLESASRGREIKIGNDKRFERELQNLRAKWGRTLAADPYYSPLLSLDPIPFSALAWPPRAIGPRVNSPPVPTQIPPGF